MSESGEGPRIVARYQLTGREAEARAAADRVCFDQTVEAAEESLPPGLRAEVVGRIEAFRLLSPARYEAAISYPGRLLGGRCAGLLNLLFGTSSLRAGVRLLSFELPDELLLRWRGPRLGIRGLRDATGVHDRPLVCAVLKPLGRSPRDLAELAAQFTRGGVDLIKDDQGLMDQSFCPFDERIARCAEAVAQGAAERGRPCLYFPHVSGEPEEMRRRARRAAVAGAGGLLVAPGLTGFGALQELADDEACALPIASHPSLLGTYGVDPDSGIAPAALYGRLPRLAGADISIYPTFGTGYAMTRADCTAVAEACRTPWRQITATLPTAAGRIGPEHVAELGALYGRDVLFILGSRVQQDPAGVAAATGRFVREIERAVG